MSIPEHVRILVSPVVGTRHTVVMEFLGSDHGLDTPDGRTVAFFDTWINSGSVRVNIIRDQPTDRTLFASSATWAEAMVQHDRAITFARRMTA